MSTFIPHSEIADELNAFDLRESAERALGDFFISPNAETVVALPTE
jgi:hypothetical protein